MEDRKIFFFIRELTLALVMSFLLPATVYRGVVAVIRKPAEVTEAEKEKSDLYSKKYELDSERSDLRRADKEDAAAKLDKKIETIAQEIKENEEIITKWNDRWNFIFFIVAAIVGVVALLAGLLVDIPLLGTGLVLGGGFTLVAGYGAYWSYLSDMIIFMSLCAALVLLAAAFWWYSRKKIA